MENKTILTFEEFLKGIHLIKEVFEFDSSEIYIEAIYKALGDKLTDQMFLDGCNGILRGTTKQEWNNAYGFRGRPAPKDWEDAFLSPYKVKKTKYCSISGRNFETEVFSDAYLEQIQQKQVKSAQISSQNEKNRQSYIEHTKTN